MITSILIYKAEQFVYWLECDNFRNTGPIRKILSELDSPFIEESYRPVIMTLRPIGAEHK